MVSMTELTAMHSGPASDRRIRRRRWAETRLKAYGIIAIALAGAALITLMSSIVGKATGALTESYITLSVPLAEAEIDPDGGRDPKTIRRADFAGITKDVLREAFPYVSGRTARRELSDLVSSGASFELAELVAAKPELIGKEITFDFLASDVTDLYLKGIYGALLERKTEGRLELTLDGEDAKLTSTAPDFAAAIDRVRAGLAETAAGVRRQAQLQENGVDEFTRRAEAATSEEERAANTMLAAERAVARDGLLAKAADLERRAGGENGGSEALTETNRSVFVAVAGGWIKLKKLDANSAEGEVVVPLHGDAPGDEWRLMVSDLPEESRKVSDYQMIWLEVLSDAGQVKSVFNTRFFTAGDSREPELAGIWGATVGSFWTMLVTFFLAFPIGVSAAIYLEEFAPRNRITDFIEVNINNLAAVPSIIFGLLGLSVIIGFFGVPRSAPLAGGVVLALMTLPTIIIAARASIAAVPPSIRDAAIGLGASPLQTSFHHVLPLSMPGILTGTIIGMARALGETAPLIMIGMVAFIVDIPTGVTDSATVLPVQIYRWSDFPERAFEARTAAAIATLLVFLIVMNGLAVFLRKRFERRW